MESKIKEMNLKIDLLIKSKETKELDEFTKK